MQQQNAGQQPIMMKPPKVITTKDLSYLKDQLSWHLNAMKKCAHYAKESTDTSIQQALDQAGRMHQRHFQLLLKHCQNNNTQAMTTVQQQQQAQQAQQNTQQQAQQTPQM